MGLAVGVNVSAAFIFFVMLGASIGTTVSAVRLLRLLSSSQLGRADRIWLMVCGAGAILVVLLPLLVSVWPQW